MLRGRARRGAASAPRTSTLLLPLLVAQAMAESLPFYQSAGRPNFAFDTTDNTKNCAPCEPLLKAFVWCAVRFMSCHGATQAPREWVIHLEILRKALTRRRHEAFRRWKILADERRAWKDRLSSISASVPTRSSVQHLDASVPLPELPTSSTGNIDLAHLSMHGLWGDAKPSRDARAGRRPPAKVTTPPSRAANAVSSPQAKQNARIRARLCKRMQSSLSQSTDDTRKALLLDGVELWRKKAAAASRNKLRIREILSALRETTPDTRAMRHGFESFRTRSPRWNMSSPAIRISEDGFTARSCQHRRRNGVFGSPVLKSGVFHFGVRVAGLQHGIVVGVADASNRADEGAQQNSMAWGLHLTHGALYSKPFGESKGGVLSTRQLITTDAIEHEDVADGFVIDIEVDMTRRKLSFGAYGAPLQEAPCTLSECVRPWAYLWTAQDAVLIDKRKQGLRRHASPNYDLRPPTAKLLIPLRTRPPMPRIFLSHEQDDELGMLSTPQHAIEPSRYLPAYMIEWASHDDNAGDIKASQQFEADSQDNWHADEQRTIDESAAASPATKRGGSTSNRIHSSRSRSPSRSPERVALALSVRMSSLSPRTSRGRAATHMWDMVRFVTGTYSDTFRQI